MNLEPRFEWTRMILGTLVAAIAAGLAYWVWPDGVTDKPLSSLTRDELLRAAAVGILGLAGIGAVFGAIRDAARPPLAR